MSNEGSSCADIVIVGPGAIGCLLACRLHASGAAVALVDRRPERAGRLTAAGIRIVEPTGETVYPLPVIVPPIDQPPPRWMLLCVKRFQTLAALELVRPLLGPETCIVAFQNGMGHEDTLVSATDKSRVLCAVTSMGATLLEDGRVRPAGGGVTTVTAWSPSGHPQAESLVAVLTHAGIEARTHGNAQSMLWSKLIVNAAINPVTALANIPNGAILQRPELQTTAHAAAREGQAVALALNIKLDYPDATRRVDHVCAATAENRSSMLQDIMQGRPTEIDSINGTIIRAGRLTGMPTSTNQKLVVDIIAATAQFAPTPN